MNLERFWIPASVALTEAPPRRRSRAALACVLVLTAGLAACEDENNLLKKRRKTASGELITRVRGLKGSTRVAPSLGTTRPMGGGATARLLIQPLEERLTRGRFVRVLYVTEPDAVLRVQRALLAAPPAPFRTCEPTWRIDLRYGHHEHIAEVNIPCQRLVLDGKSLTYDGPLVKVLGPHLRRAAARPLHKLLRVRVPVIHPPEPILKALAGRAVETFLPEKPARRGPFIKVFYSVLTRPPSDPTRLDRAVAALRKDALGHLGAFSQQLKLSRHEVVSVRGPNVVFEHFNDRLFEAKYEMTVIFKLGTPDYVIGFLGLDSHFTVGKVSHPKEYRIDVVFGGKERYSKMRKTLGLIQLKPPLRTW